LDIKQQIEQALIHAVEAAVAAGMFVAALWPAARRHN